MADKPASERTEKPTPDRLKKARQDGQIPQSQEVFNAILIAGLFGALAVVAGQLNGWIVAELRTGLSNLNGSLNVETYRHIVQTKTVAAFVAMFPILAALTVASLAGSLLVGGWAFSPKAIKVDVTKLDPVKGAKNLISVKSFVQLGVSIAKMSVILGIAWWYLGDRMPELVALQWSTPEGHLVAIGEMLLGLVIRICVALAIIAVADLAFQKWQYIKKLMMTRQEVKQEMREHELSPELRGRIRSIQMSMAKKRMLQDVPTADVVVTNPTHYAVAIRYEAGAMDAPTVVAKGADHLCQKIKEIARDNNVPVVERPQLARALFAAAEPGDPVPESLFIAVAEVLAMIYRLRGRRRKT